ncbi:BAG family molecular chaperone regulator 2 [Lethenteron reissneri]|uniref:BAG family molecular chaperone regulator 2 n=1 Tax=Lethenteron reissneri TaxID=7753 RepID=UPI002AB662FD|nr:BAG family molecular chaperone regulator 2 [Lethenteron reissneri]
MNCFLLVQPRVPLSPRGVTVRLPSRAALSTGEREELSVTAERLLSRTLTVEVALETLRNAQQQEALRKASSLIDDVAARLRDDLDGAKRRLASLHGACHADGEPSSTGPLDRKFQSLVIGCALEDRRKLKKRLATLIRNVENADRAIKLLDHQYQKSSVSGTGTMTRR